MKKGIFTISIDVELLWGICDKPIKPYALKEVSHEREVIKRLLELFSKYDTRATWGITAHLLLSDIHDPLWYGRDIVEWIRNASPSQEIGSHSFCHIPYNEKTTNRDSVRADIRCAKELHEKFNLPFKVFIFPRNIVGFRDILAEEGVQVYRGNTSRWYDRIPVRSTRRLLNLLYFIIGVQPKTVKASMDETVLLNIPDSMLLFRRNGLRSLITDKNLIKMAIGGLNRAVDRGEIFHLWFHPSNLTYKTDRQFYVLESVLNHAANLRERGKLEVLTMSDIYKKDHQ